ncbi:Rv2732c family membrane protein [Corynebacterium sp. S7]
MSSHQPVSNGAAEAERLAAQERKIATTVSMGNTRWVLVGVIVVYVLSLFLPYMGGISGLEILIHSQGAQDAGIKITESAFVWLSFLGIAVFTTLLVITKRSTPYILAWSVTTVALIMALLALWLRQTSSGAGSGIGIYLAILAVIVAEIAFITLVTKRNPEQEQVALARTQIDDTDEVGHVQLHASTNAAERFGDDNPLLIDDRRARASERHRKQAEKNSDK